MPAHMRSIASADSLFRLIRSMGMMMPECGSPLPDHERELLWDRRVGCCGAVRRQLFSGASFLRLNVPATLPNSSTFTPCRRMMTYCCRIESVLFQAQ